MTEDEIINGCKQNNKQCQYALFRMYAGRMMSVCLRYASTKPEAEDMLQNAFIKIFNAVNQYRHEGAFEGWIRKITVHECLASLRKKNIKYTDNIPDAIANTNELLSISQISEKELITMINKLPEGYRVVFNLHIIEGYSHDEIAAMLNVEPVTSRSQLLKARKLLQKQLLSQQKITATHDR